MQDDSFLQEALLLGRHHKVVCVVLVVDDVFQVNPLRRNERERELSIVTIMLKNQFTLCSHWLSQTAV